ncbi:helix-turn-helix transcriptional regulator [Haladaptatus caseinilyticus]|uniref:helix-turn-helix transcriptional regulator n=1 Tax=Haladaptatus caseinilyticus TaxID=2993314 RepID=UPI00224AA821|nr:GntR family transcriptional regulator [Haladaptatus caseinilyticus]
MGNTRESAASLFELVNQRYDVLVCLDSMVCEKRDLMAELDISRSTIDRALHELETEQLVTRKNPKYRITLYGRTLLACYESILTTSTYAQRAKPLLVLLPPDINFEFSLLIDAEIHLTAASVPDTPITRIVDLIEEANHLKGLVYAHTSPEAIEFFQNQILHDKISAELVFRDEIYTVLDDEYPEIVANINGRDNFTGYLVTELSYSLLLFSTERGTVVCLIVYDDNQQLRGIIVNDTERAVAWGEETYERYRRQAVPCDEKG